MHSVSTPWGGAASLARVGPQEDREDDEVKGDEGLVEDAFCRWLVSYGRQADRQADHVDVLATGPQGQRLLCELKGSTADIGTDCDVLYGQLLRRMIDMSDPTVRFAAVVRTSGAVEAPDCHVPNLMGPSRDGQRSAAEA